jgi:hypothetical protein
LGREKSGNPGGGAEATTTTTKKMTSPTFVAFVSTVLNLQLVKGNEDFLQRLRRNNGKLWRVNKSPFFSSLSLSSTSNSGQKFIVLLRSFARRPDFYFGANFEFLAGKGEIIETPSSFLEGEEKRKEKIANVQNRFFFFSSCCQSFFSGCQK